MKIYRAIGTVFSVLLALIFTLEIFGLALAHGTARAVNKQTISDITEAFLDNEALYGEMTDQIATSVSASLTEQLSANLPAEVPAMEEEAVAEVIDEILNTEEFKNVISDVASDYIMNMLESNETPAEIDVAEKVSDMFTENTETFDTILENTADKFDLSYDDIYEAISSYTEDFGVEVPEHGASYSELMASIVESNNEALNSLLNQYLGAAGLSTEDLPMEDPDIDYAPVDADSQTEAETEISEMEALMQIISEVLAFLKSPVFIAMICDSFLLFFGISALLTWSIRRPLLISGIMAIGYGALLLSTSSLVFPTALVQEMLADSFGTATEAATDIIMVAWNAMCENLMLFGILALVHGVLFIALFILWRVLARKKAAAQIM